MRAVVIGGGIGGLAVGISLRNAGCEVKVHERAEGIRSGGAGLILWNNALRALDLLGIREEFENVSFKTDASLFDRKGRTILDGCKLPENLRAVRVVQRKDLLNLLFRRLGADQIQFNSACIEIEQDSQVVRACFSDGSKIEADLLIAADGLHSRLRSMIAGNGDSPVYAGYTAWRAITHYDFTRVKIGEFWGPQGRFGCVPMTEKRILWFATRNSAEGQHAKDSEKMEVFRTFSSWHESIGPLVNSTAESDVIRHDVYDRSPAKSWVHGRAALLGDAAHAMVPVLGQGACQALEDAIVLGECLRGRPEVRAALQKYQHARLARANYFVNYARIVGRLGQLRSAPLLALRDSALIHLKIANGQMLALDKLLSEEVFQQ